MKRILRLIAAHAVVVVLFTLCAMVDLISVILAACARTPDLTPTPEALSHAEHLAE